MLKRIVESDGFTWAVVGLILVNAVTIGLGTYPSVESASGGFLDIIDDVILYLFTLEIFLRFAASDPKVEYFKSGWNMFDFAVVAVGYLPATQFFMILRMFRILRILRSVTVLPELRRIVVAFLRSIPSLAHIVIMLGILLYVYGTIGTVLFSKMLPSRFGTLQDSIITMFSTLTLDGWTQYYDEIAKNAPWAWLYFVSFIVFGTFITLNFFVGVIVTNLPAGAEAKGELDDIRDAVARIEAKLQAMK